MKKLFITLSLTVTVLMANAQIQKGTMFIGGNAGFSSAGGETKSGGVSVDDPKSTNFNIAPVGGYYVTDKIAVTLGVGFDYALSKSESGNNETKTTSNLFSVIPGVRYNMPITEKFGAFLQGSAQVGFGGSTNSNTVGGVKTSVDQNDFKLDIGIAPGILYFIKENLAIEASYGRLGYNTSKSTNEAPGGDIEHTRNTFDLGLNTRSLSFGFLYYLNK